MTRSCEKLGCNEPAEVAFGIDRVACVVWLENFDEDEPRHLNRMCDDHAARLTLPRSWSFDDRRESSPRLFVARRANVTKLPAKTARQASEPAKTTRPTSEPAKSTRKSANKTGAVPRRTSRDTSTGLKRASGPSLFDPTLPMNSPVFALAPAPTGTATSTPVATAASTAAVEPELEAVSAEAAEPAYAPKFDRSSDVGGALNATGRLLRRAFSSQTRPIERPTTAADTDSLPQGDHIDDFNQGDHVE